MKLITYNLNGIRAAIRKGFLEWLAEAQPDILCLQEVKSLESQVDLTQFAELGYTAHWHAATIKKGYSGVATFSKQMAKQTEKGLQHFFNDEEGRVLKTEFEDFTLINAYFPSGTTGEERQNFKYEWLDYFYKYIAEEQKKTQNLIIVGDFNIAHQAIDIHNPTRNKNTSGFQPEERAWLTKFLEAGFVDSFRSLHREEQKFSWWTYRAGARKKNLGWRIDYIMISESLQSKLEYCDMLNDVYHSDHCPVEIVLA